MIQQVHHVCVLTANIEALGQRLHDALGVSPPSPARTVSGPGVELRTTMLPIGNGTFLQLLEPHAGPGVAELTAGGDGSLYEVAFQVDDAEKAGAEARRRGLVPSSLSGLPLDEDYAVAGSGSRYLYLPRAATGGLRVELLEPPHAGGTGESVDHSSRNSAT